MNASISFSKFNLKYLLYSISFLFVDIIIYLFIFDDSDGNIIVKHKLLDTSFLCFGYLLNIIPEHIFNNNPDKHNLSIKDIIKLAIISIFSLFFYTMQKILNKDEDEDNDYDNLRTEYEYEDYFMFIEFFVIFIIPHSSEVYYKHQKLSFLIFSITEIFKVFLFLRDKQFLNKSINESLSIILEFSFSIVFALYLIYIKELMKYKFVSPYKVNFIVGMITFPLIIIIYIIISLTSLGKYVDNIKEIFKDDLSLINVIRLITFPLGYGIYALLFNKIIYDFTLYHIYIPLLVENFVINLAIHFENKLIIFFLIIFFLIELAMILIFLEIIELNFCGLNENLKKNIEFRALADTPLENKEYDDEEVDNERDTIKNEKN